MGKPERQPPDPFSAALRMLARRAHSTAELRQALHRKFPGSPAVRQAVTRLRELGLLDDMRFAEQYASSLMRNRALGPLRIARELRAKRVSNRNVDHALKQAFEGTSEAEVLERVLDRKVRSLRLPLTRARFYALCRSLQRRGFRADDIMKAVRSRPQLRPVAESVESLEDE